MCPELTIKTPWTASTVSSFLTLSLTLCILVSSLLILNIFHTLHDVKNAKIRALYCKKKSKLCRFQIEVFPLPPYPTPSSEYRPIKFALCPYIRLGHINGILRYFLLIINKLSCLHLWEIIIPNYNTLGKAIPNHKRFWEIIIPKHNTIWER